MGKVANLSVFTPGGQPGAPNPSEGLAALRQNQTVFMETIGVMPPESLTIADGAISPTTAVCIVDTEGGAPADDLMTVNATLSDGGTLHDGMVILLSAKDASHVVTVKNSDAPNGMKTVDGKDIALSPEWCLVLQYVGGVWQQINVSAPLKPATKTTLGGVKVGDGLTMGEDGTLSADLATAEKAGRVKASETAKAGAVPLGGEDGTLDESWVSVKLFNTRIVITESTPAWQPPVTGWARVTVIGGGGGGGRGGSQIAGGGLGGGAGGQTSFGEIVAAGGGGGGGGGSTGGADVGGSGGGGASGAVNIQYVYLVSDTPISVVIGAGGAGATATTGTSSGGDGGGSLGGKGAATSYVPGGGGGVVGGGNGGNAGSYAPFTGNVPMPGAAGNGGSNGTGYGGGGGGGSGDVSSSSPTAFLSGIGGDNGNHGGDPDSANGGNGGDGGQGAVIIEYYDPAKEAA